MSLGEFVSLCKSTQCSLSLDHSEIKNQFPNPSTLSFCLRLSNLQIDLLFPSISDRESSRIQIGNSVSSGNLSVLLIWCVLSVSRKRISMEKQPESRPKTKKTRVTGRAPRVQLSYVYDGLCGDKEVLECVGIALSSWNERSLSEQGHEYKLVEPLGCLGMLGPSIYHCNFIARPKNASEVENKLFFAEVEYSLDYIKDGKAGAFGCNVCCIIGSSGTVTGLFDCQICELHPKLVQHPENGEFIKGRGDAIAKYKDRNGRVA